MSKNTKAIQIGDVPIERRTIMSGAAWSLPVFAAAVASPHATASPTPTVPPGITINYSRLEWNSEWNTYINPDGTNRSGQPSPPKGRESRDQKQYNGWIADGLYITLGDANGVPLANKPVTFTISGKEKQFWFVKDPEVTSKKTRNNGSPTNLRTLTLMTDANGRIDLDGGRGAAMIVDGLLVGYRGSWGYLRKGQDDSKKTTLTVTAEGYTASVQLWNYTPTSDPYWKTLWWPGLFVA